MDDQMEFYKLELSNKLGELSKIHSTLEVLAQKWNFPLHLVNTIELVLEEAFTNIVNYAFNDKREHPIVIEFVKNLDNLEMTLIDDGLAYDPTRNEEPKTDLPIEDRPVGGLGILLIRRLMDSVDYQRIGNKNLLTLTKNISK